MTGTPRPCEGGKPTGPVYNELQRVVTTAPEGTECPQCGDNQFSWWYFERGTGASCAHCGSGILVYGIPSNFHQTTYEKDVVALGVALRKAHRTEPGN